MDDHSASPTAPAEWNVEIAPESRFVRSALARLTVPRTLALDFLAMYSRFEYALKVTAFRQSKDGETKADWKEFAKVISERFDPNRSPHVNSAFHYLIDDPPNQLETRGKSISWNPMDLAGRSGADRIIWIIKQVRHNLFHGGKFAQNHDTSQARDGKLLSASIVLMEELISLDDRVQEAYLA